MNRHQRRALTRSKDPQDLARIAAHHKNGGRIDKAEAAYREAIARDPHRCEAHNDLGGLLVRAGRFSEATTHFAHAFRINPRDAMTAFNLALGLSAQHRFKEAADVYREAIALDPANADLQSTFAFTLTQLGEYDDAERHYMEALKIDPLHFEARVNLGLALVDQGKVVEAFEHAQILSRAETASGFPHKSFGILLARAGCPDGAKLCFENHLARHPGDRDEIAMLLASVGGAVPARASDGQIAKLYDERANRWDNGATGATGYQGHRLVAGALALLNAQRAGTVVDAGCGTGLVGELLRAETRHLVGVDMSEPMLAQARQKNVYDELHRGDLIAFLNDRPRSCDVIASAATLIHFGDLDAVFRAAARCLREGGHFVFTVFPNDDDPGAIAVAALNGFAQGGCFRHGHDYIAGLAAKHGFTVVLMQREVHEYARKVPIFALVVALRLAG
ncbi:tetratricopeptide repeat protein [Bradyrhizobium lablabi]|uniref:tetratricopeptide repeat protein n=1 Tax=Bradyrhizobium lablabi TaxID=722472 RepID=UPI001BA4AFBA|nr:tetratricopeptide repeat protein [Bradyrhizobium lablabi]MBR1124949.1 tetratricopeptide repeat protein [Bradyrhizobium lablabi]